MARKREAWEIEAQTSKNVQAAIERTLLALPKGGSASLALLWQAMETCKVPRAIFDRAVWVLTTQGRVRKIKDRLYPPVRHTERRSATCPRNSAS
jgi:hypothetical protein